MGIAGKMGHVGYSNDAHSTVILREYFKNILLKACNIARIFIKLLHGENFMAIFRLLIFICIKIFVVNL